MYTYFHHLLHYNVLVCSQELPSGLADDPFGESQLDTLGDANLPDVGLQLHSLGGTYIHPDRDLDADYPVDLKRAFDKIGHGSSFGRLKRSVKFNDVHSKPVNVGGKEKRPFDRIGYASKFASDLVQIPSHNRTETSDNTVGRHIGLIVIIR